MPNVSKIKYISENKSLVLEILVPPREDKGALLKTYDNNLYEEKGPLGTLRNPPDISTKIYEYLCVPTPDKIYISGKEMCILLSKYREIRKCLVCFPKYDLVIKDQLLIDELESLFDPVYELHNGGTLIFSHTPALVAIDVNGSSKTTAEEINYLAAEAIPRQLKLRNIGGVIFVDFVSMSDRASRIKLVNALRKFCRTDKRITRVSSMSRSGFIEIIRQRQGIDLNDYNRESLVSMLIARRILSEAKGSISGAIIVKANPKVISILSSVENVFGRKLNLYSDKANNIKEFEITFEENKIK